MTHNTKKDYVSLAQSIAFALVILAAFLYVARMSSPLACIVRAQGTTVTPTPMGDYDEDRPPAYECPDCTPVPTATPVPVATPLPTLPPLPTLRPLTSTVVDPWLGLNGVGRQYFRCEPNPSDVSSWCAVRQTDRVTFCHYSALIVTNTTRSNALRFVSTPVASIHWYKGAGNISCTARFLDADQTILELGMQGDGYSTSNNYHSGVHCHWENLFSNLEYAPDAVRYDIVVHTVKVPGIIEPTVVYTWIGLFFNDHANDALFSESFAPRPVTFTVSNIDGRDITARIINNDIPDDFAVSWSWVIQVITHGYSLSTTTLATHTETYNWSRLYTLYDACPARADEMYLVGQGWEQDYNYTSTLQVLAPSQTDDGSENCASASVMCLHNGVVITDDTSSLFEDYFAQLFSTRPGAVYQCFDFGPIRPAWDAVGSVFDLPPLPQYQVCVGTTIFKFKSWLSVINSLAIALYAAPLLGAMYKIFKGGTA